MPPPIAAPAVPPTTAALPPTTTVQFSEFSLTLTERDAGFDHPVLLVADPAGGDVYRGTALPELDGHYFFTDFCSGKLWSISPEGSTINWTESVGAVPSPSSFGVGGDGELYVVSHRGSIFRMERSP